MQQENPNDQRHAPHAHQEVQEVDEVALHLPDGQVVLKSGKVVRPVEKTVAQPAVIAAREIKNGRQASDTLERIHRKLGDLPEQTEKMNAIACVLMYTGVGLRDDDIAIALRTSTDNVRRLKELDAYKQLSEMFDGAVFEDAKRTANHIVTRASARAANRIVSLLDAESDDVALAAARDVTRLAGVGADRVDPAKISSLNIKITRKGDKNDEDNVTVEFNHA
jgi:hypothetical protein